ncbi:nuclease-related domain-containing protein [Nocardioides sp. Bht2]|uniref:nuclease-related domain-containing protein n=1 Tax=Nocardioides sp. Bht2 TaxID=3392297 RepID=UPI0039B402EA
MSSSESGPAAALAAEREELAAARAALAAEREALDADRARLNADRATLATDRARHDAERMALAESARVAAARAEQAKSAAAGSIPTVSASSHRMAPATSHAVAAAVWRQQESGCYTCVVGNAATRGEHELLMQPWPEGWLVVAGLEVTDRTRSREVDALVIAPHGLLVIEQKDTSARGSLLFAPNGPPLLDGIALDPLSGALRQARLPAQMLGTSLSEAGIRAGYVAALLAIRGQVRVSPDRVGATHLAVTRDAVRVARSLLDRDHDEERLTAGTVLAVLSHLALPLRGLPSLQDVGFADSSW